MSNAQSVFNIIGPVMIGPSSSHTAGAARIGYTAQKLLGEALLHPPRDGPAQAARAGGRGALSLPGQKRSRRLCAVCFFFFSSVYSFSPA